MNRFWTAIKHVCVDHGGFDILMPQQFLDSVDIITSFEQVAVLHTWGRTLTYHPHVHYLVPAGGVDETGNWLAARNAFFLPVKALAKIFRAKFR